MKSDKKLLNGKAIVIEYFEEGEGVTMSNQICAEKFKQFLSDNINEDVDVLFEDQAENMKMTIKTITVEENRENEIRGTMWGECCSREQAIRIVDDLPLLSDEEEEIESAKHYSP